MELGRPLGNLRGYPDEKLEDDGHQGSVKETETSGWIQDFGRRVDRNPA